MTFLLPPGIKGLNNKRKPPVRFLRVENVKHGHGDGRNGFSFRNN